MAAYFNQPDKAGHESGPDSAHVNSTLGVVDEVIGRFWAGFKKRNISDCVNMIIVSDHGMSLFNQDDLVDVEDVSSVQSSN